MNHAQFWGSGGAAPYEIEQSLRFDGGAQLSWTPSSAGNLRTFTRSAWFKRAGKLTGYNIFASGINMTPDSGHTSQIYLSVGSSPESLSWKTTADWRDVSAWYHLVFQFDTTQATADDRAKLYINGVRVTDFWQKNSTPAQNYQSNTVNAATAQYIGGGYSNWYFDGYQAEHIFVDGQALDPEDFGEFDDNGVWRPIEYTGTFGSNGYYLKFDPTATNGIGHDHSGNGNNWTASGFTTSGTGTDVMSDTPTTNWCTLDPLTNGSLATLSDGNLSAYGNSSSDNGNSRSTFAVTSGKWYCEFDIVSSPSGGYPQLGIMRQYDASRPNNGSPQSGYTSGMLYPAESVSYWPNGQRSINSVDTLNWGSTWTTGDTIAIALDGDNGAVYFAKNGTWQNSGDPTSGSSKTGAALTWTDVRDYVFTIASYNGSDTDANFGQRAFAYTPPTGFKALNTSNLPAPDIADGSQNFNTVTYTGDGTSSHAITGVGFQPDWVWLKSRSLSQAGNLIDAVRGVDKYLRSSSTAAEATFDFLSSFDTDGFTLGTSDAGANQSSATYVAWNWLGANGTSSNTDGSITSTVSANASAGFSIVSYTGNGTAGATLGHGLGVTPKMIIVKQRSGATDWQIGHTEIGWTKTLYFNTSAATTETGAWNNTAPTSTVFSVGTSRANTSSATYIAYCFAEVEGYSKFGSYTGNGSSNGPFVFTGHKVAWVMIKDTTGSGNSWYISDNKRNTYNVVNGRLMANLSNGESTSVSICDFTANGFKIRTNDSGWNTSGSTYIFASFSENPFGGSGVSPATAR